MIALHRIESASGRWAAVLLAAVLAFATWRLARIAAGVPLWYDELLTVRISEFRTAGELWGAVTAAFDFNPPLIYVATKVARSLPVDDPLAARLPALAGFVIAAIALAWWLWTRVGPWIAAAAVALMPLADYTVRYAVEARAYMLLLGVSACALMAWSRVRRTGAWRDAAVLSLLLAGALLLHVWAVLLLLALGAGELAALVRRRRVDWRVAAAVAGTAPLFALHSMLLRGTKTMAFDNPAYAPSIAKLQGALISVVPRPRALLAVLATAAVGAWLLRRRQPAGHAGDTPVFTGLAWDERLVLLACLLSPLVPYAYGSLTGGVFMPRYALYALLGLIGLLADALFQLARRRRGAEVAAALVAAAGVAFYLPPKTVPVAGGQAAVGDALDSAVGLPDLPIVLVNPIDVLTFEEHASEAWLRRTVFVADAAQARAYTGTDAIDLGYIRGQPYLRLRSRRLEYAELVGPRRPLLLAGKWQALTWLPQRLRDDGWRLTAWGGTPAAPIYLAEPPAR